MQILIVNFNLDGLSEEEFESSCDELAPAFAAVPGLASKVWLAERAEGAHVVQGVNARGAPCQGARRAGWRPPDARRSILPFSNSPPSAWRL